MAKSPAHKFGQIIGNVLEETMKPLLGSIAQKHGLYLDYQGSRYCRSGNKVTWTDMLGNSHDLDFVLERNGSDTKIGDPVAFIETAWRRYTKHSRNKAQEIEGAVRPLLLTYSEYSPFAGAILAGEFTLGALTQLESVGFTVLHFSYETVVSAFDIVGMNALFGEDTPTTDFDKQIKLFEALSPGAYQAVIKELVTQNQAGIDEFTASLESHISRRVIEVIVLPLFGKEAAFQTIKAAILHLSQYDENTHVDNFVRYEVILRYEDGTEIDGRFPNKVAVKSFLSKHN